MAEAAAAFPPPQAAQPRTGAQNAEGGIELVQPAEIILSEPPQKTFEEVFRQSGLAWQAYIAIFVMEFILALTWATYCVITLYNITQGICEVKDEVWPIILFMSSMKFAEPWVESWCQSFIRSHTVERVNRNEPTKLTYRKAMNKYKLIRSQLKGWTHFSTFMMAAVWTGINSLGGVGSYWIESALHILLGLSAGTVSILFRNLCKHIYWNNFKDEIYDSISQVAKATCLVVSSLGFMRATELYYDLSSSRILMICLLLNVKPMCRIICSGNHFAKPPSCINRSTPVITELLPREPFPPTPPPRPLSTLQSTAERPSPSRKLQSSKLSLPKFGSPAPSRTSIYDDAMSNQKYQRLEDFSSPRIQGANSGLQLVDVVVHHSPTSPVIRRPSQSPRRETTKERRDTRKERSSEDMHRIESVESASDDKHDEDSPSTKSTVIEVTPPSLEGTGAVRKQVQKSARRSLDTSTKSDERRRSTSPSSSSRSGIGSGSSGTRRSEPAETLGIPTVLPASPRKSVIEKILRSESDSNVKEETMTVEECEDIQEVLGDLIKSMEDISRKSKEDVSHNAQASSPAKSDGAVTIHTSPLTQSVTFKKGNESHRVTSRSTDNQGPEPDPRPATGNEVPESRTSCFSHLTKRFCPCFTTEKSESSGPSIPAVSLRPSSPKDYRPQLERQDKRFLMVENKLGPGPVQLHRSRHRRNSDPNQISAPEPTRLEASARHGFHDEDEKYNMVDNIAESVQVLIMSLKRSFRDLWFWYTIMSTALVNLLTVLFLVACPYLALSPDRDNLIEAADALVWIALPWLLVSLALSLPITMFQSNERRLYAFGLTVYIIGLILTAVGMTEQQLGIESIYPWLMFGVGFGVLANLNKTIHNFFCYSNENIGREGRFTSNAEIGTGVALIIFYFIYYISINVKVDIFLSIGHAYFLCSWAGFIFIATVVKFCTIT